MPQIKVGTVVADKMQKAVVVKVVSKTKHPLYKKLITKSKKFKVHDSLGVKVGQKVKIVGTRPISKGIHFMVLEIVN